MSPQDVVGVGGQPWLVSMFCANFWSGLVLVVEDAACRCFFLRNLGLSAPSGTCCGCGDDVAIDEAGAAGGSSCCCCCCDGGSSRMPLR